MAGGVCLLIIALLLCLLWLIVLWARRHHAHLKSSSAAAIHHRLLKPRTPDDCPACRRQSVRATPASPPAVRPWRELKSRRGRPKQSVTDGFACPTPTCSYYRITDATVHALVGDGTHGKR